MKRQVAIEVRVGIFAFLALLIAGIFVFSIGERRNMFSSKVDFHAYFPDVSGLRPGSPVRISGVDVGTVKAVTLSNNGKTRVTVSVASEHADLIREGSSLAIIGKGLLGDKLASISIGTGKALAPGATIRAEVTPDLSTYVTKAGRVVDAAEGAAQNIQEATEGFADPEFGRDVHQAIERLSATLQMVNEGRGPIHRFVTDEQMADDMATAVRNLKASSAHLAVAAENVRAITTEVRSGDGSAHELLYGTGGTELINNLAQASGEVTLAMNAVRTGDGLAHDVIYENNAQAMIDNFTATSADIRAIVADTRAGKGTIGGFLADPSVYEDIKRVVGDLERNEILRALVRYSIENDEAPVRAQPSRQ